MNERVNVFTNLKRIYKQLQLTSIQLYVADHDLDDGEPPQLKVRVVIRVGRKLVVANIWVRQ